MIRFVLFFMLFGLTGLQAQEADSLRLKLIDAAKEIMNKAPSCTLITLAEDGSPRSRAMAPFAPEDDLVVWFGTNSNSQKLEHIKKDPRVNLYYLDEDNTGYVQILGKAQIIDEPETKRTYFKKEWKDFYPDYPKNYTLIRVEPIWMEIISERLGILGDEKTWKAPRVVFE